MQRQSKAISHRDASDEQVEIHLAALRRFIARRVSDSELVEDLVQESYARMLARSDGDPIQQPQAYLFRVAGNLMADIYRRDPTHGQVHSFDVDDIPVRPEQEDAPRLADLQQQFEQALAELPSRCRDVFIMRRFDDLDTSEVATRMGISHRMVQKYLSRAVAHLHTRLRDHAGDPK